MPPAKKRFCPKGHDTEVVGRDRWSYCKACSGLRKRSLEYRLASRAYDRRRRDDPDRRAYRQEYDRQRRQHNPQRQQSERRRLRALGWRRMASRIAYQIGKLPPQLWGLFR